MECSRARCSATTAKNIRIEVRVPRIQVLEVRREEPVPGRHEFRRKPCPQIQRCVRKQSAWTTWKCPVHACRGGCPLAAAVTQHTQQLQSLTRLAAPTPRSQQAGSRASMLGTVAHSTLRIYGRQERDRRRQIRTRHCLAPSALSILTTWRRFGLGQLLLYESYSCHDFNLVRQRPCRTGCPLGRAGRAL